jgi:hypothetical protein
MAFYIKCEDLYSKHQKYIIDNWKSLDYLAIFDKNATDKPFILITDDKEKVNYALLNFGGQITSAQIASLHSYNGTKSQGTLGNLDYLV